MANIKDEFNISEERYIEIKEMAYQYYGQYNNLERPYRRKFLDALPGLNTRAETDILRCTLLFPDTEYLLEIPKGKIYSELAKMANQDDNTTTHDVTIKTFEYSMFNVRELVANGKLKVMDEISYPEDSISDKEYIETKISALKVIPQFYELSLMEKVKLIGKACQTDTYQARIQIATLLIPNDRLLMQQLSNNTVEEIAKYYKVPTSVIEFKQDEYGRQGTDMLINDGRLGEFKLRRVWHKDPLDNELINKLWDQSFYASIENEAYQKINSSLEGLFAKPITKILK